MKMQVLLFKKARKTLFLSSVFLFAIRCHALSSARVLARQVQNLTDTHFTSHPSAWVCAWPQPSTPVCPGLDGWESGVGDREATQGSWNCHMSRAPSLQHMPYFSTGLTYKMQFKDKIIKISRWKWQNIKSQLWGPVWLPWWRSFPVPPIFLISLDSFHISLSPGTPALTNYPGCRWAVSHLTGKSTAILTPSAAFQAISVLTSSHTPHLIPLSCRRKNSCMIPK